MHRPERRVMDPEEMCRSCIHVNYCMGAYRKDHWCGNHTGHERKYEVSEMWKRYRMAMDIGRTRTRNGIIGRLEAGGRVS